jgi:DNA polymerase III epsilon subunit-like protein
MHVLVVYDLETTGLSPYDDAVTEVAAAVVEGDSFELARGRGPSLVGAECGAHLALNTSRRLRLSKYYRFSTRVRPPERALRRMSLTVQELTGITKQSLLTESPFGEAVLPKLQGMLEQYVRDSLLTPEKPGDTNVTVTVQLVGHNSARFDDVLLMTELQRYALRAPLADFDIIQKEGSAAATTHVTFDLSVGDTLRACRKMKQLLVQDKSSERALPNLKLETLYKYLTGEPSLPSAHTAMGDCEGVVAVLASDAVARAMEYKPWQEVFNAHAVGKEARTRHSTKRARR